MELRNISHMQICLHNREVNFISHDLLRKIDKDFVYGLKNFKLAPASCMQLVAIVLQNLLLQAQVIKYNTDDMWIQLEEGVPLLLKKNSSDGWTLSFMDEYEK